MTTKTKTSKPNIAPSSETAAQNVRLIPLASIDAHPGNPGRHRITAANTKELAGDIFDNGLQQPILVRPVGDRFQIVFGERRYRACKHNKARNIAARVEQLNDGETLMLMAVENGQREDIDPFAMAEHLQALTADQPDGTKGLSQAAAGKPYNLTQAAVSNAIRLLQLPPSAREAVNAGEMPTKTARFLIPFCAAPALVDRMVDDFKNAEPWDREGWDYEDTRADFLRDFARDHTRPMDGKTTHFYGWQDGGGGNLGNHPRRFDPGDVEGGLPAFDVVDLPIGKPKAKGKAGELVAVTVNVDLFDQHNKPLCEAAQAKQNKPGSGTRPAPGQDKAVGQMSKAEKAKHDKAKAEERKRWRQANDSKLAARLLRAGLAIAARERKGSYQTQFALLALCENIDGRTLAEAVNVAIWELEGKPGKMARADYRYAGNGKLFERIAKFGADDGDEVTAAGALQAETVALIAWPQSKQSKGKKLNWIDENCPPRDRNLATIPHSLLSQLAKLWKVTSAQQWANGAKPGPQRDLITQFVGYLRRAELEKLAKELKLKPTAADQKTAKGFAAWIIAQHTAKAKLACPKALTTK